tara:strand:- start:208 stop:363 length:156 start_codon:yes stop_codon:yes gene_type:complete
MSENIPSHIAAEVNINVPHAASLQNGELFVDKVKSQKINLEDFYDLFVTNC